MTRRSKPTLTLLDYRLHPDLVKRPEPSEQFRVHTLNGSTNLTIGQWLDKKRVEAYIDSGWNVNLRGPIK